MPYIDPHTVLTPQGRIDDVDVIYDSDPQKGGWSIARLTWDSNRRVAIRWNGFPDEAAKGNPQSHGHPTWFILPEEIEEAVLTAARKAEMEQETLRGYLEMAANEEGEQEAIEWIESHAGECL